jgi:hypothetical protein
MQIDPQNLRVKLDCGETIQVELPAGIKIIIACDGGTSYLDYCTQETSKNYLCFNEGLKIDKYSQR